MEIHHSLWFLEAYAFRLKPTFVKLATRLGSPTSCIIFLRNVIKVLQGALQLECMTMRLYSMPIACLANFWKLFHINQNWILDPEALWWMKRQKYGKLETPKATFCPWRHALSLFTSTLAAHLSIKYIQGNLSVWVWILNKTTASQSRW